MYTTVYTLAFDGHVGRSRVRNPAPLYFFSCFMFSFLCATHTRYARTIKGKSPTKKRKKPGTPLYFVMFYVFSFVFSFLFINTPMEVVCPVCMFVYTAVYMLAADGAVYDATKKKSMVMR